MFEKVNPMHPDKVADRIAGALVDLAYSREENPKVAVEVLIGHGYCYVIAESSVEFKHEDVEPAVTRIVGKPLTVRLLSIPQDAHLAQNQADGFRCGDNGIFKGTPVTREQQVLTSLAHSIYGAFPTDGKYVIHSGVHGACFDLTICQSHLTKHEELGMKLFIEDNYRLHREYITINPLGEWTGGPVVDTGATNRKLGSDLGEGVTGGGLHGKDLSKGDVSINIVCFLKAVQSGQTVTACCSIGDEQVTFQYASGKTETETFADVVEMARLYILTDCNGSFETFSEWGLIRPKS